MKIGIIGGGNMGAAIYKGLLNVFPAGDLYLCDKNAVRKSVVKVKKNFCVDPDELVVRVDTVIFAVKPQSFPALCEMISVNMKKKLVISIMAGVSLSRIAKLCGADAVVRSMPNLPAQVYKGLTGWIASRQVTPSQKKLVVKIFSSFGEAIELDNEEQIDAVTALSGSGPAYFFYLCELLSQKAVRMGFKRNDAEILARRTMIGAAHLLEADSRSSGDLRRAVTSKGGTTEAALKTMKRNRFERNFNRAVDSAFKRSRELNS